MQAKRKDWLFHWLAPVYDYLMRRPRADRIQKLLNLPPNGSLLDAGGGTGRVSSLLSGLPSRVTVCDINRSMLKQALRKKGLSPLQADATALPFARDTFDGVLVVDALHHFFDPPAAIREMMRVLKPGGRLLIEEQDIDRWPIRLVQFLERRIGLNSLFLSREDIRGVLGSPPHTLEFSRGDFFAFRVLVKKAFDP